MHLSFSDLLHSMRQSLGLSNARDRKSTRVSFGKRATWAVRVQAPLDRSPRHLMGSPGGSHGKESACDARATGDAGSIPGCGRSPGAGRGSHLQDSCLGNPVDRGAWRAAAPGVAESRTRLGDCHSLTPPCGAACLGSASVLPAADGAYSQGQWALVALDSPTPAQQPQDQQLSSSTMHLWFSEDALPGRAYPGPAWRVLTSARPRGRRGRVCGLCPPGACFYVWRRKHHLVQIAKAARNAVGWGRFLMVKKELLFRKKRAGESNSWEEEKATPSSDLAWRPRGQRSLAGCSPGRPKGLDTTLTEQQQQQQLPMAETDGPRVSALPFLFIYFKVFLFIRLCGCAGP